MSKNSKILVLMAVYNGVTWVSEQIESILTQEGCVIDVVIMDDNSTDGSFEFINKKYLHLYNVELYRSNKNSGSAARNFYKLFLSINIAGYDYIALCDQDDIWSPGKLGRSINILNEGIYSGYSSAVNAMHHDGSIKPLKQSPKKMLADFLFEGAGQGCTFVLPSAKFLRVQEFIQDNLSLVENFHFHDWLVYILIRSSGGSWYFDPHPTMLYRQHESNEIGARNGFQAILRRLAMIKSGWYKKQIIIASSIYVISFGGNKKILEFISVLKGKNSLLRRLKFIKFIYFHGRRRIIDRYILILSVMIGWI